MSKLDEFFNHCATMAQRLGIAHVVIAARDPESGEPKVMASQGALAALAPALKEKLGVDDGAQAETAWPGL